MIADIESSDDLETFVSYCATHFADRSFTYREVQVGFGSLIGTRPQMQANRVRGIAVTSKKRSPSVDLPTVSESGLPNYEVDQWYGVITSSKVPKPIVTKLYGGMLHGNRRGWAIICLGAADVALWDIAGKALGRPVYQVLGGAARSPYQTVVGSRSGAGSSRARESPQP